MMRRFTLLVLFLIFIINNILISQGKVQNKQTFYQAESWILFEDYKEALPLYLTLNELYPSNANFKYRIGQCYINMPGEKEKAILYLEDAVKNINPGHREGKFRETGAPYDALYYLANAYRIDNQIDKAIEHYDLFKKNMDPRIYDSLIVNQQTESCRNAKKIMEIPVFIREKNSGSNINETSSEYNPVVSGDEKLMIFSKSLAFYEAILYSIKTGEEWGPPVNMNEILGVDYDFFPTSLSKDGKELFMYSSSNYDGVIYSSSLINGRWTPPLKLNDNINTKFWESHATISADNKKLYFTSNRKGTYGGLDIYVSHRDSSGNWGPAVNLGPVINTPYNEETPFLSNDDKTLFFSSRGHYNMGGYDIFYSALSGKGEWSGPVNMGYPLNTTDDDIFFNPVNEGYEGYIARYSPDGFGKQDILRIEIFSDRHPRNFQVRGIAKISDLRAGSYDSIKISALNIKDPDQLVIVWSDSKTGEYEFSVPHGKYEVTYESPVADSYNRILDLPLDHPSDSFEMPGILLLKNDYSANLVVECDDTLIVKDGKAITIPLRVEPGSTVVRPEHPALIAEKKAATIEEMSDRVADIKPAGTMPAEENIQNEIPDKGWSLWYLWLIVGGGLLLFLVFHKKKKKGKEAEQD